MNDSPSALDLAERSKWKELAKLVQKYPESAQEIDDVGMMSLHWACTDKNVPLDIITTLLQVYPDAASEVNKGGLLPLHIAVKGKLSFPIIKAIVLMNKDALCEETPSGETPADLAQAIHASQDVISYLIREEDKLRATGLAPPKRNKVLDNPIDPNLDTGSSTNSNPANSSLPLNHTNGNASHMMLPPRWMQDKICAICQTKFGYLKVRHHCRNCGASVCNNHSKKRLPLHHIGLSEPQRVCLICYDDFKQNGRPKITYAITSINTPERIRSNTFLETSQLIQHNVERIRSHTTLQNAPHPKPLTSSASMLDVRRIRTASGSTTQLINSHRQNAVTHATSNGVSSINVEHTKALQRSWLEEEEAQSKLHVHSTPLRPNQANYASEDPEFNAMQEQVKKLENNVRELLESKAKIRDALYQSKLEAEQVRQAKQEVDQRIALLEKQHSKNSKSEKFHSHGYDLDRDQSVISLGPKDVPKPSIVANSMDDRYTMDEMKTVDVAGTCNYLGLAFFEKGEYSSAILEFRKSIAIQDDNYKVWYNLAKTLHATEEYDDAESSLRRALDLNPNNQSPLSLLGKVLHAKGDHDGAIEIFRRALGLMTPDEDLSDSEEEVGAATVGW